MTAPNGAAATKPKPAPPGGIKLLNRKPPVAPVAPAAPDSELRRLSLDGAGKKAPAAPIKGPSELFAELLEASGGDVAAAAARIKELLAAGSRDAAALGGMGLQEGIVELQAHGGCTPLCVVHSSH